MFIVIAALCVYVCCNQLVKLNETHVWRWWWSCKNIFIIESFSIGFERTFSKNCCWVCALQIFWVFNVFCICYTNQSMWLTMCLCAWSSDFTTSWIRIDVDAWQHTQLNRSAVIHTCIVLHYYVRQSGAAYTFELFNHTKLLPLACNERTHSDREKLLIGNN